MKTWIKLLIVFYVAVVARVVSTTYSLFMHVLCTHFNVTANKKELFLFSKICLVVPISFCTVKNSHSRRAGVFSFAKHVRFIC
jgi:hypothetical protein